MAAVSSAAMSLFGRPRLKMRIASESRQRATTSSAMPLPRRLGQGRLDMPGNQLMSAHDGTFLQMPRECRPSTCARWGSKAAQTKRTSGRPRSVTCSDSPSRRTSPSSTSAGNARPLSSMNDRVEALVAAADIVRGRSRRCTSAVSMISPRSRSAAVSSRPRTEAKQPASIERPVAGRIGRVLGVAARQARDRRGAQADDRRLVHRRHSPGNCVAAGRAAPRSPANRSAAHSDRARPGRSLRRPGVEPRDRPWRLDRRPPAGSPGRSGADALSSTGHGHRRRRQSGRAPVRSRRRACGQGFQASDAAGRRRGRG